MTIKEFNEFWNNMCQAEVKLLDTKGTEYSGEEDRFRNFKDIAAELDMHPAFVAWVYFKKHLDSIKNYIKNIGNEEYKANLSEPIIGRFNDARNYLALMAGIIEEGKSKYHPGEIIEVDDLKRLYFDKAMETIAGKK